MLTCMQGDNREPLFLRCTQVGQPLICFGDPFRIRFADSYFAVELNGTGLGLWISKGIMERHHGHLRVRSSQSPQHHGTVFSLFLPCLDSVDPETQRLSSTQSEFQTL